jgi:5'-methylthioadenosine phosphorylase
MAAIGIIGGSGLYEALGVEIEREIDVDTPYGLPSAPFMLGRLDGLPVYFLTRHGISHEFPPHKVNYRANLWGFRELGVTRVLSLSASGGVNPALEPGTIVLIDQVLDFTGGARAHTFYEDGEVVHVDFTEPYCPEMREALSRGAADLGQTIVHHGTYACTNGPRLESAAEIRLLAMAGADVVGMTGMPEAALAREAEICYATLTVVTNPAAGLTGEKLTTTEVVEMMRDRIRRLMQITAAGLAHLPEARACRCKDALKNARM